VITLGCKEYYTEKKKYTAWEFKTTAVVGKALKIPEIKNILPA